MCPNLLLQIRHISLRFCFKWKILQKSKFTEMLESCDLSNETILVKQKEVLEEPLIDFYLFTNNIMFDYHKCRKEMEQSTIYLKEHKGFPSSGACLFSCFH